MIYTNTGQSKRGIEIEAVKDQETFRKDDISIKRRVLRNDSQTILDAVALERVSPLNSLIYGHQLYKHLQPAITPVP